MRLLYFLFFLSLLVACTSPKEDFSSQVEQAHKKSKFLSRDAVQFDIYLKFGEKERLKGTMILKTNSSSGLIELENGTNILYKDDEVYYSPEIENESKVRFDAYTWSYFFLLPYKLSDPGTIWTDFKNKELNEKTYNVEKLSFESGVGDAPDDWYIVYANPENNLIDVAAYIVTYSKSVEEAESDPHAIEYKFYQNIDGVPIAREWAFWGWSSEKGLSKKKLGEAVISNIQFIELDEGFFNVPTHYKRSE